MIYFAFHYTLLKDVYVLSNCGMISPEDVEAQIIVPNLKRTKRKAAQ